ncbi:MAG: DUF4423 domain-containing protein [Myxococcota bacterium]
MERLGVDWSVALGVLSLDLTFDPTAEDLARWLRHLKGTRSVADVARAMACSDHRIGRWMRGDTSPRLPDFLALVDILTGRLTDFVAALVPIDAVPSLADHHRRRTAARDIVVANPYAAAVLTLVEAGLDPGLLDAPGGVDALDALVSAGLLERTPEGWVSHSDMTIALRPSRAERHRLQLAWASVARERLDRPEEEDLFTYNVFAVSAADYRRIRELQLAFYKEVRGIVATSPASAEVAALLTVHLMRWAE